MKLLLISFVILLASAQNQDCEMYTSKTDCSGKTHDEGACYWKAESGECIEGEHGDLDHICGEYEDSASCFGDNRCGWEENACKDRNDVEVYSPPTGTGTTGTGTGATGTGTGTAATTAAATTAAATTAAATTAAATTAAATTAAATTAAATTAAATTAAATTAGTNTGGAASGKCEDNISSTACNAQAGCFWNVNECDEGTGTGGNTGVATDCEMFTETTCSGNSHDGKICLWSQSNRKCVESSPGDMEHICDQYGDSTTCAGEAGCGWDVEGKCVQASDLEDGNRGTTGGNTGGNTGATGVYNGEPDCEMYLTAADCNGKSHEGKVCYWSAEGDECDEAAAGDPEHMCPTLISQADCDSNTACGWQSVTNTCLSLDDYEADCEMYVTPTDCNGKTHEGKACYWANGECDEATPGDPEHLCATYNRDQCNTDSRCGWNEVETRCMDFQDYEPDCEMYLTSADCNGKVHEGKACYWSAEGGECEEGEHGDLEHVCGQFGGSDTCTIESGCVWDMEESKCEEMSSIMLSQSQCSTLGARACSKSQSCYLNAESCEYRFKHTHQSETSDKTNPLWFAAFVGSNVVLGALCALCVRFVICTKSQPQESYVNLDHLEGAEMTI